jgi:hypothetical protein
MGIRSRLGVQNGIGYTGLAAVSGVLRRVTSIRLPTLRESISVDMLTSDYLPYEASQTYRKIMIEFDCTRARAIVETQRQLMRSI